MCAVASQSFSERPIEVIAQRCRALSDPIRIRLLGALRSSFTTMEELRQATGSSEKTVAEHLNVLLHAGLVSRVEEGSLTRYALVDDDVFAPCRDYRIPIPYRKAAVSEAHTSAKIDSPTRRRVKRRATGLIAQYIHELSS